MRERTAGSEVAVPEPRAVFRCCSSSWKGRGLAFVVSGWQPTHLGLGRRRADAHRHIHALIVAERIRAAAGG